MYKRQGELTNEEFTRLVQASQALHQVPLFIDDTPALTVSALRTRARRLKRQHKLGLIVVDYLQLISGSAGSRNDGRVQEVSEITRGLKTLAKELHVPVVALSQLSRQVENREDKRPQLADLRESGSIEQDADVVMFIYRDEVYNPDTEEKGIADILVRKHRNGPTGDRQLYFQDRYAKFADLERRTLT